MNAIYSCCIADPFLDVARKLEMNLGVIPVYWIGDIQSTSVSSKDEEDIKTVYPDIIFQKYFDAWKGVFPTQIEKKALSTYVDIDFLRMFSSQELQAISMMDRQDYDRHSFIFMERERYYYNLVKKWLACFDLYKPDVVISAVNPHRVFDYVLYLVCRYKKIKFISFQFSMEAGRVFPIVNFSDPGALSKILDEDYQSILNQKIDISQLPEDIRRNYEKLSSDYRIARPTYMAVHDIDDVKNKNMLFLFRRFMKSHKSLGIFNIFKEGQTLTIYKNVNCSLEQSRFSIYEWYKMRRRTFEYNNFLFNYYCSHTSDIDLNVSYIVFFLHYQPEETTSPNGDIFANQSLCIETLLKNTPEKVMIYVKEHPNQFMSHMQGFTKRIKEFYDDLLLNPRVKLVPFDIESFSLISNALAVSTVTGTVGWEAAVRKKPVIIFGFIWYERMKGVLRVFDDISASKIYDFISNYEYNESAILSYLYIFSKHSILAYHYQSYKEITGYTHTDSVDNIYKSLAMLIKNE